MKINTLRNSLVLCLLRCWRISCYRVIKKKTLKLLERLGKTCEVYLFKDCFYLQCCCERLSHYQYLLARDQRADFHFLRLLRWQSAQWEHFERCTSHPTGVRDRTFLVQSVFEKIHAMKYDEILILRRQISDWDDGVKLINDKACIQYCIQALINEQMLRPRPECIGTYNLLLCVQVVNTRLSIKQ